MTAAGWWARARCASVTPGRIAFFTEDSRVAKSVCRGCPVRIDCLGSGLYEPTGVWGGLDRRERSALVRLRSHIQQDPTDPEYGKGIAGLCDLGFTVDDLAIVCDVDRAEVARLLGARL